MTLPEDATLSQTAHEIESILKKIPESFLSRPPFDFENFRSPYKQCTFNDKEDDSWLRQFFHSSRQLEKHYPLAIPHESQLNRFKNQGIIPIQLLAVFYYIVTVVITHNIVDSYLTAIDSLIPGSHANPSQGIVKHAHMLKPVFTLPGGQLKMSMPRLPQNTASTPMDTKFTPWLIPYHIKALFSGTVTLKKELLSHWCSPIITSPSDSFLYELQSLSHALSKNSYHVWQQLRVPRNIQVRLILRLYAPLKNRLYSAA